MKLLLTLVLISSVLADFTYSSLIEVDNISMCQNALSCEDVDLHNESSQDHKQENHNHHCDCHVGHSHSAVAYRVGSTIKPIEIKSNVKYPLFKQGQLQNYHSKIIRPPIS